MCLGIHRSCCPIHHGLLINAVRRSQELTGDPFALLLKQRILFLGGEVSDFTADAIVSQLLLLDAQDQTKVLGGVGCVALALERMR